MCVRGWRTWSRGESSTEIWQPEMSCVCICYCAVLSVCLCICLSACLTEDKITKKLLTDLDKILMTLGLTKSIRFGAPSYKLRSQESQFFIPLSAKIFDVQLPNWHDNPPRGRRIPEVAYMCIMSYNFNQINRNISEHNYLTILLS